MADKSSIEWTDATWNPTRGCTEIAPGCAHCYAKTFAERFRGVPGHPYELGFDPRTAPDKLKEPLKWRKPRRIFVDSMSDLFHESFPADYIGKVWDVMAEAQRHTFQVLTKRPERAAELVPQFAARHTARDGSGWPLANVWIGTSIANQTDADKNIPQLMQVRAAVLFLSIEPLLGPVDLHRYLFVGEEGGIDWAHKPSQLLDWVIVGGESGPDARPCNVEWIRSIVAQCKAAGVPVFVKQLGANVIARNDDGFEGDDDTSWPEHISFEDRVEHLSAQNWQGDPVRIHLRDRKGGDWNEWPADLRVREFPEVRA